MSGYPNTPPGYGYGQPPPVEAQPYTASPYGAAPPPQGQQPYAPYGAPSGAAPGTKPHKDKPQGYGVDNSHSYGAPSTAPYGAPAAPYGAPSAPYGVAPGAKPPKDKPLGYSGDSAYGAPPPQADPYGSAPGIKPPKDKPQGYGGDNAYSYGAPPPQADPYGAAPGIKPPKDKPQGYGSDSAHSYGAPPPQAVPYGVAPGTKPPKDKPQGYGDSYGAPPPQAAGYPPAGYGSPFAALVPSAFPPNTDPNVVSCFQTADQDGSGLIDDKELQRALSSYNQSFSLRTVHLLMYLFTNSNSRKIGPKEFTAVFYSLQSWRGIFDRFDQDRSGKIDINELRDALMSLGFHVSPIVLDLLVSKFDKSGGHSKAIEYDNFIECCLTVKGLTEKFKEKDTSYAGSANFTYEGFMLTVLPFLIA